MSAGLLRHPPEIPAGSLEEIIAAAGALESAAAQRYQQLARTMRHIGHEDVAQIFEDLAVEEQQHVAHVERLASTVLSRRASEDIVRWVLPETFGSEEAGPVALLTPYKALSIAVRAEERAFAFWSYVAANAAAEPVRALAETMARQELLHASKIRIARRRAYHAESRREVAAELSPRALSLDALRSEAAQMAVEAAAFLSAASARLSRLGDSESANLLLDIANAIDARGVAPKPRSEMEPQTAKRLQQASAPAVLFEAEGVMERWAERYVTLLDRSPDAAVTVELQRLADETMRLVARISLRLSAVEPDLHAMSVGGGQPSQSSR